MTFRAIELVQGSVDWHKARAGVPTSSKLASIKSAKGFSDSALIKLAARLAAELASPDSDRYESDAMLLGIEHEKYVLDQLQREHGEKAWRGCVSFTTGAASCFICSPDAYFNSVSSCYEIKTRKPYIVFSHVLENANPREDEFQCKLNAYAVSHAFNTDVVPVLLTCCADNEKIKKVTKLTQFLHSEWEQALFVCMALIKLRDEALNALEFY
jgi:hypothetical protein